MLTKFHWNSGKWCFLQTEMMQIRYSIMKLNKHIIKETQFDSAKPCSNKIFAINFLVQILIKAGRNQTWDLKFWDVFPYFPKHGKDVAKNDKIGQNPPKNVAGRRRTSQGVAENVAENVAGVAENVAGRRRRVFWQKLSFSPFFGSNWAKPWLELVSDTPSGESCRFFIETCFSAKHGGKPWFQQGGLCVFQRKLANRVPLLVFGLYPAHPMLPTLWQMEDPQKISMISLNIGHNFKIFWGSSLCYLRKIARSLL